jgi:uncharacterized membrane protein
MNITLTTPAMLFPAISLLLLAYTNKFVTLATVIRTLDQSENSESTQQQIENLRERIQLIKRMQEAGVTSFFLCVLSMLAVYLQYDLIGSWIFAASLVFLLYSLWQSVLEIRISVKALDLFLSGYDYKKRTWKKSNTDN